MQLSEQEHSSVKPIQQIDSWYHQYGESVYRRCLWLVHEPETARDITQEVFIRAYRNMHSFRGDSSPYTWLCAIADRRCFTLLKQRSYRRRRMEEFTQRDPGEFAEGDAEHQLIQSKLVQTLLTRLRGDIQKMVMLRFYDELEHEEIARLLQVSRKTVQRKLNTFYQQAQRMLRPSAGNGRRS